MLTGFDHVNIRTAQLDEMIAWYSDILGLKQGPRPPFPFPGAWMYLGDQAIVHLVGVEGNPGPGENPSLEHFALRAQNRGALTARLDQRGVGYSIDPVPGLTVVQVNLHDPDGNHIHIDFDEG